MVAFDENDLGGRLFKPGREAFERRVRSTAKIVEQIPQDHDAIRLEFADDLGQAMEIVGVRSTGQIEAISPVGFGASQMRIGDKDRGFYGPNESVIWVEQKPMVRELDLFEVHWFLGPLDKPSAMVAMRWSHGCEET